jgi:hypothetical protein
VDLRSSNSQNLYKIHVDATISESFQGANTQYVLLAGASFAITSASGVLVKIGEDDAACLVSFEADAESLFLKSTPANEDLTAFAMVDPIVSSVTSDPDVGSAIQ